MKRDIKGSAFLIAAGAVLCVWAALKASPYLGGGLPALVEGLEDISSEPFKIVWTGRSLRVTLCSLIIYAAAVTAAAEENRAKRPGTESGSARWGDPKELSRRYRSEDPSMNKIMTENVMIGLDARRHKRNLNTLVIGGSGAGKTRSYVIPNLLQPSKEGGCSFFVLDPKSEILRSVGGLLEKNGYRIRVLDLLNMEKSHSYNPLRYIETDNDVQRLVTNLFKSTQPKKAQAQDPFWDTSGMMLLSALIYYLHYMAPPEEQNFSMVMDLLRAGAIKSETQKQPTPLDKLFEELELKDPGHIAVKYYNSYHSGSPKTLMSIQITLAARLEKFNVEEFASLTVCDEMDLDRMGEEKTAIFAVIPDNDTSYNFLVSILYTQLFQQLFSCADGKYKGSLPVPVHLILDEFANVSLPHEFDKILSVMRSRNVFVSIILQNMAQLKALYEKEWESIAGNCDQLLYLGGNEQQTHEYISRMLGRETIVTESSTKSKGRSGSYSLSTHRAGRELLTPDEVRKLDNSDAIFFMRGEDPVIDRKYDVMRHPNVKYTETGGAAAYEYGRITGCSAVIELIDPKDAVCTEAKDIKTNYVLLSEADLSEKEENQK